MMSDYMLSIEGKVVIVTGGGMKELDGILSRISESWLQDRSRRHR